MASGSTEIDKAVGRFDFVTTDFEDRPRARGEGRRRGRARPLTAGGPFHRTRTSASVFPSSSQRAIDTPCFRSATEHSLLGSLPRPDE